MAGENSHLFCFGFGYTASFLAKELLAEGWRVSGTCRTSEKCESLRPMGITAHIFDDGLPLTNIWDLDSVTHILISIPPSEEGDIVLQNHLDDLLALKNLQWIGYLSTTGVYGDHSGDWVDENTPVKPYNDRTARRVEAEQKWLASGLPVHVFRLSGIYGPGRSAIDSLQDGAARRIDKAGQVFSRIHVEDICGTLIASIKKPDPFSIYNVADDEPCSQAEVIEYAANLIGAPVPPLVKFEDADLSPMAKSFYAANRRVSNKKIKEKLGVELKYPDYRVGLSKGL